VKFTYSYTGDWNDIAKAKEAATPCSPTARSSSSAT
jgi:hypothetical protein